MGHLPRRRDNGSSASPTKQLLSLLYATRKQLSATRKTAATAHVVR